MALQALRTQQHRPLSTGKPPTRQLKPPRSVGLLEAPARAPPVSTAWEHLTKWVVANGGHIHQDLTLEHSPISQCRGVLAAHPIEAGPLIEVPEALYLTTDDAATLLRSVSGSGLRRVFSALQKQPSPTMQLSLALAHERAKGPASFWFPYIASLPDAPPCAWRMSSSELAVQLQQLGPISAGWGRQVQQARGAVQQQVEAAVAAYGKALEVDEDGVEWALGQVVSRAFGSGKDVGMAPVIDLCNHSFRAMRPAGRKIQTLSGPMTVAWVGAMHDGEPKALAAGEELFVSYGNVGSPLHAFLNFGFVPPELLCSISQD